MLPEPGLLEKLSILRGSTGRTNVVPSQSMNINPSIMNDLPFADYFVEVPNYSLARAFCGFSGRRDFGSRTKM